MESYERLYSEGGFGYEADRAKWVEFVAEHYVAEFDLLPPRQRMKRAPRPTLLDLPCGNGFWTAVLSELGFDARGVDLSEAGVEAARTSYPDLQFDVGNAEEPLPVGDAKFDVVFSRAITHLHRETLDRPGTYAMVANLMSYVAPKGQLLVSYYSKRDGGSTAHHHYHPVSDLVALYERVGDVWHVDVVNNFVQLSVRHRA